MKAKFKFGVKQIVLTVVSVLLLVILIVGNIVLNANSITLHKVFNGLAGYGDGPKGEAYEMGDALTAQLVEDSAVLFRNENNALPLDATKSKENKVNLFGWNATTKGFMLSGTGSGGSPVLDSNRVTLAEAFVQAGYEYNETLYNDYVANSGAGNATINNIGQASSTSMNSIYNPDESFYTEARMQQARDYSDVAIIVISRNTGENCGTGETLNFTNYSNGAWLELTAKEKSMLKHVTDTFSDGKVIVLLNTTNTMELGFLEEYNVDAALYIGAPGQSGARAIPHLLYGQKTVDVKDEEGKVTGTDVVKISPSGKTSDTYAYNYNLDSNGKNYSASWTSALSNGNSLYYQEGIYIGYKWYETADAEGFFESKGTTYNNVVQYPFGYGMSYTNFRWDIEDWPSAKKLTANGEYTVKVKVTNIGEYAGKDVVELYYTPPYVNGGIEMASTNLLAFGKTVTLQPNESQTITLTFTAYDLASYDDYDKNNNNFKGYELENGTYTIALKQDAHTDATCYDKNGKNKADNTFEFTCDGIQIDKDPKTGATVENLFTGENAYASTPIDGSTAYTGTNAIEYLSRENSFANFPNETTFTCKARSNSPSQTVDAAEKWANEDISSFQYGVESNMYLVTKEDGSVASANDLNGKTETKLVANQDLMETLWDYNADEWEVFLDQLSQNDITQLIGQGKFQTVALTSVGKPFCNEFDGPAGFNENSSGKTSKPEWVVFPVEALLGCSWNPQSTYSMGQAMGKIGQDTGVHGWYGPGLNLHRSPYYGRNFEYYSEDAVLTGKLVAQCIKGAKEYGLTCYMKHFACADTGPNSPNWYTWLTEQNLRENYLKPFEIAVKEGGANAVMSGFSAVGAIWAGSNWALSTQVLRNEWGFRGSMITDWENGYMDKVRGILGGNDLWLGQSGTNINYNNVSQAYCARQSAKNILYTYVDCYMTAYEYGQGGISAGTADYSPLFVALWVIVDVLLVLGIATCVLFIFVDRSQIAQLFKGKKAVAAQTASPAPTEPAPAETVNAETEEVEKQTPPENGSEN